MTELNLVDPLSTFFNCGPLALGLSLPMAPWCSPEPPAHLVPNPRRLTRQGLTGCHRAPALKRRSYSR